MDLQKILGTVATINELVQAGRLAEETVVAFLRSAGADDAQLARNRVILASDVASIDQELKGGRQSPPQN